MQGEVVFLYAFDVANEIATAKIGEILGQKPYRYEINVARNYPRDIPLYKPLAIEPPPLSARLRGQEVRLLLRVYEVGVVTVTMRTTFQTDDLQALRPLHAPQLEDGRLLDRVAYELCGAVCENLKPYLLHSALPGEPEAYTVFCLTDLGGERDTGRWLTEQGRAVAGLISDTDPHDLSDGQVAEVLRLQRSFGKTDLIVIDWDAALAVDLTGYVEDVLYVVELANLQLEEFRTMDQFLDRTLNQAYEHLEKYRFALFRSGTATLRALRRFRVDLTRLADEVTHITKFFGDWYLARVYLAARERFHLDPWRSSVEGRLAQLDHLYQVIHAEVNERRMLWLEAIIVILFIIDIVALFWGKA